MNERLDCGSCELQMQPNSMCGVVAARTVRQMVKVGYDISSDMRPNSEIVQQQIATNQTVRSMAEAECELRLLQHQSMRQGYGTVTY